MAPRRANRDRRRTAAPSPLSSAPSLNLLDPIAHTPYVRRFTREVRSSAWRRVDGERALRAVRGAHVVLLGDYHPLPSASQTAMTLLRQWRAEDTPCALGLEMVYARDQAVLDSFLAGDIGEAELRRRMRYREEWGYPWAGPRSLLRLARDLGVPVRGLDIPPRGGASELAWRDAVAAERVVRILRTGPAGVRVVVLFGEAHLAASHLPGELRARGVAASRVVRVLHDLETDAARGGDGAHWLRADRGTFARQALPHAERGRALTRTWRRWAGDVPAPGEIDLSHLVHGLIEAQAEALRFDPRRFSAGPARWLADRVPEVFGPDDDRLVQRIWRRAGRSADERRDLSDRAARGGVLFEPRSNVIVLRAPEFGLAALAAGWWLVSALRSARAGDRPADVAGPHALDDVLAAALALIVDPAFDRRDAGAIADADRALGARLARALRAGRVAPARIRRWIAARPPDSVRARALRLEVDRACGQGRVGDP